MVLPGILLCGLCSGCDTGIARHDASHIWYDVDAGIHCAGKLQLIAGASCCNCHLQATAGGSLSFPRRLIRGGVRCDVKNARSATARRGSQRRAGPGLFTNAGVQEHDVIDEHFGGLLRSNGCEHNGDARWQPGPEAILLPEDALHGKGLLGPLVNWRKCQLVTQPKLLRTIHADAHELAVSRVLRGLDVITPFVHDEAWVVGTNVGEAVIRNENPKGDAHVEGLPTNAHGEGEERGAVDVQATHRAPAVREARIKQLATLLAQQRGKGGIIRGSKPALFFQAGVITGQPGEKVGVLHHPLVAQGVLRNTAGISHVRPPLVRKVQLNIHALCVRQHPAIHEDLPHLSARVALVVVAVRAHAQHSDVTVCVDVSVDVGAHRYPTHPRTVEVGIGLQACDTPVVRIVTRVQRVIVGAVIAGPTVKIVHSPVVARVHPDDETMQRALKKPVKRAAIWSAAVHDTHGEGAQGFHRLTLPAHATIGWGVAHSWHTDLRSVGCCLPLPVAVAEPVRVVVQHKGWSGGAR